MKKFLLIVFITSLLILSACVNEKQESKQQTDAKPIIAFYNVENLFDTIDDKRIDDEEFLPGSKVPWNSERYQRKLDNLSQVISSIGGGDHPAVVGLCEVENKRVLFHLIRQPKLEDAKYNIIHRNSPDERGIDVALLFNPDFFLPIENEFIRVSFPFDREDSTREILYTKGMAGPDTLHLFVNHWPSRYGGREKSQPKRNFVAGLLKDKVDSLFAHAEDPNIILMGDFNDNPTDTSLAGILNAKLPDESPQKNTLYNLSLKKYASGEGTIYWKNWDMFDQIIVSSALLNESSPIKVEPPEQFIFKEDWMLFQPEEGPARPNRTKGRNYYGGYSDHLPVYIKIDQAEREGDHSL